MHKKLYIQKIEKFCEAYQVPRWKVLQQVVTKVCMQRVDYYDGISQGIQKSIFQTFIVTTAAEWSAKSNKYVDHV